MQLHVFRGRDRIFAFTKEETGSNLPSQYGPWNLLKTLELNRGDTTPGVRTGECLDDIETFGIHVTDAHIRITETVI